MNNYKFWSLVKPFLTNKGVFTEYLISINIENVIINDEKHLVELFKEHYIDIVQEISGKKITSLVNSSILEPGEITFDEIIEKYKNRSSSLAIKDSFHPEK